MFLKKFDVPSDIRLCRLELELRDMPGSLQEMRTEDEHHVMKAFLTSDDERAVRAAIGVVSEEEATFQRQIKAFYRLRDRFVFPVRGFGNFVFKDRIRELYTEVARINGDLSNVRATVLRVLLHRYRTGQMKQKIMRFNPRIKVATFILPECFVDKQFRKAAVTAYRKKFHDCSAPELFPVLEKVGEDGVSRLVGLYDDFKMNEFMRESEGVVHPNVLMLRAFCYHYGRGCTRSYEESKWAMDASFAGELDLAESGDRVAQANLGLCFKANFSPFPLDYSRARFWLEKSAEQGYVRAKHGLGVIYWHGLGVKADTDVAKRLFREGVEADCLPSAHNLALMLDDDVEAFRMFQKSAEGGVGAAYVSLARCYHAGRGVAQDNEATLRCLRKAWELGENVLEVMMELDLIGDRKRDEVIEKSRYTTMSREQLEACCENDIQAQTYLAFLLLSGARGVEQDKVAAVALFKRAAESGERAAQCLLGECYYKGDGVDLDQDKAFVWFERAAEQGACQALGWMGLVYLLGEGCDKDLVKASEYMRKAVEAGNMYSRQNLACFYLGGGGNDVPNYEEAVDLLWPLACNGWPSALYLLANCYNEGMGVARNGVKASCLLSLAAASGDVRARAEFCKSYGEDEMWWSVLRQNGWNYEIDSSIVEMMASGGDGECLVQAR